MSSAHAPGPLGRSGRHAWVDAGVGVAGDMLLGALIDAGASLTAVQDAVDTVIPGQVRLVPQEVRRAGLRATLVDVRLVGDVVPHRRWAQIRELLEQGELSGPVRASALTVFDRLAQAEAQVHGIPREEVVFHEVGAWDAIADVVGVAAALHDLGVASLSASPVAVGSGAVATDHGELPVPTPAVLELARGWRVVSYGTGELATPTGMALIVSLAESCEPVPALTVEAVGVGAGSRQREGWANIVRVVLGRLTRDAEVEDAVVLEANVDDLDPRTWPGVLAALLDSGAADAWLTPIVMKKGRPAHTLAVLAAPDRAAVLRAAIFSHVPTFGVRESVVTKTALARTWRPVDIDGVSVGIKLGHCGGRIISATPEFDDVARAAAALAAPEREILDRAVAAAAHAGLAPGHPVPPG